MRKLTYYVNNVYLEHLLLRNENAYNIHLSPVPTKDTPSKILIEVPEEESEDNKEGLDLNCMSNLACKLIDLFIHLDSKNKEENNNTKYYRDKLAAIQWVTAHEAFNECQHIQLGDAIAAFNDCIEELNKSKELLKDIYDYIDVENEGVSKEAYDLVERIRELK